MSSSKSISSGINQLDELLGGLLIGDNVVFYDAAGSLATVFCHRFIASSRALERPLIYVCFDRSPRDLLARLGQLADYPGLIILDCFTNGKGEGSGVFQRFYQQDIPCQGCRIELVQNPEDMAQVSQVLYQTHGDLSGEVRFIFESMTGMQNLWGGEGRLVEFYSRACPRLYELETVAYWILEKEAHSSRLKAKISRIAQVVIELSIKRGTTYLSVLKADKRDLAMQHRPHRYWIRDDSVTLEDERRSTGRLDLGQRLRQLRGKKGLSQSELARLVGVTPSSISQVESNLIYPSLSALLKMAEVLSVDLASFFSEAKPEQAGMVFAADRAVPVNLDEHRGELAAWLLTPLGHQGRAEPYLLEIQPQAKLSGHFFAHKGEEIGYLLQGRLTLKHQGGEQALGPGDLVYLTSQAPSQWSNPGKKPARLLWIKLS